MLEKRFPRMDLVVVEDHINGEISETWKAEPPWWKIPFGDWPGEATRRIIAPARVIYSVPLNSDWTFRVADGIVEVTAPTPITEAVEVQSAGVEVFYDKTTARFDESQMEDKLRKQLLAGMRQRADAHIPQVEKTARIPIEKFVTEFLLKKVTDAPVKSVVVRFTQPKLSLQ